MRIGKVFGIPVDLHISFIVFVAIILAALFVASPDNFLMGFVTIFFLFGSVFVHELFHSLVSQSMNIRVERILLLPIGGVSMSEEMPEEPKKEFLIAVAGPLFNFLIVAAIYVAVQLLPTLPFPREFFYSKMSIHEIEQAAFTMPLFGLFWINLLLGAFNLFVPALPMDGGRVLRSALSMAFGHHKATKIASTISAVIAILMFFGGLFFSFWLSLIAIFVYLGSRAEIESVEVKEMIKGVKWQNAINKRPAILVPELSLQEVFEEMQQRNKPAFLVDLGNTLGIINDEMLAAVARKNWIKVRAAAVAKRVPAATLQTAVEKIFVAMVQKGIPILPVVENGVLIGTIESADIENLLRISKLQKSSPR